MNLLTVLLAFLALVWGTKLVILANVWIKLRRLRLRSARVRACDRAEFPREIDTLFDFAAHQLEDLGFVFSHAQWADSVVEGEDRRPHQVFHHPWLGTYATVCPPLPGTGERSFQAGFSTGFENGTVVATYDGVEHLALSLPPCWECYDHRLNDLRLQWEHHEAAIRDRLATQETVGYSPEEFAVREEKMLVRTLAFWQQKGWVHPVEAGSKAGAESRFRIAPAAALRFARDLVAENHRLAKLQRAVRIEAAAAHRVERSAVMRPVGPAAVTAASSPAARVTMEGSTVADDAGQRSVEGRMGKLASVATATTERAREARAEAMAWEFEYLRSAREHQVRPVAGRALLFTGSIILFAFALGLYASWRLVGFVLAAVLIHELGHLAGMIAFGYKDRQILFLPFLGAATVGRNPAASAWQRTFVYLLGPLPGLMLGFTSLILFYRGGASWWLEFGLVALVVNYLNLLPFVPLDGGRVVETLILGRFPRAQAVFLAIGALAFAWVAWRFGDAVLGVLALVLAGALPAKWRWATAVRRITPRLRLSAGRAEKVKAVFETLCRPPFETIPAAARIGMADGILEHFESQRPTLATAVAGAMLYGVLLIAPFTFATPYLSVGGESAATGETQEPVIEPRLDQASLLIPDEAAVPAPSIRDDASPGRRDVE